MASFIKAEEQLPPRTCDDPHSGPNNEKDNKHYPKSFTEDIDYVHKMCKNDQPESRIPV